MLKVGGFSLGSACHGKAVSAFDIGLAYSGSHIENLFLPLSLSYTHEHSHTQKTSAASPARTLISQGTA